MLLGAFLFALTTTQVTPSSALVPGSDHPVIRGTFYPQVVSGLMVFSGLLLLVVESIRLHRGGEPERWMLVKLPVRVVLGSMGLLAAVGVHAVVLDYLGFIAPSAVLATFLARWFGAPSWPKAALTGLVATVAIYLLFTVVFDSPLPSPPLM